MLLWDDKELQNLFLQNIPLIDVRAPCEFSAGIIPHSINLPIMNDEERRLVGTCYKEKGQEEAIRLGHSLVCGEVKEARIAQWREYIDQYPNAEVFCFRGGLRSRITCQWIDRGKQPINGGYKRLRQFFFSWLEEAPLSPLLRVGGPTGSRKTPFIQEFIHHIDLEGLAHHRGSAFGYRGPQPSQTTFENYLALQLMTLHQKLIIVEDESATIGKITIPKRFYQHLRICPRVVLKVPFEERVSNIFEDYVDQQMSSFFYDAIDKIQKSLGGLKHQEIKKLMQLAFEHGYHFSDHEKWIAMLLRDYYDPVYERGLKRNNSEILFIGTIEEIRQYIQEYILKSL